MYKKRFFSLLIVGVMILTIFSSVFAANGQDYKDYDVIRKSDSQVISQNNWVFDKILQFNIFVDNPENYQIVYEGEIYEVRNVVAAQKSNPNLYGKDLFAKVKTAVQVAEEAVRQAEYSYVREDLIYARNLVEGLRNEVRKEELRVRLFIVEEVVDYEETYAHILDIIPSEVTKEKYSSGTVIRNYMTQIETAAFYIVQDGTRYSPEAREILARRNLPQLEALYMAFNRLLLNPITPTPVL